MFVLDEVLIEEYSRLKRMKSQMEKDYLNLPVGYISQKRINGCIYYYLQHREGKKVVSRYIKPAEVENIRTLISRKKSLKASLNNIEIEMKKIKRGIK
ncbi:MAG: hypothetical protein IKH13_05490 [Clostridia bacterium]|nr:hypothetical protein [Clostridia bacterium]